MFVEHELTRCHEGLTKDNHGARTMALQWHFYFEFSADCRLRDLAGAVTWLTGGLRLGLLVFHLKA